MNKAARIFLPLLGCALLAGFVVMLIIGAYYTAHPQDSGTPLKCNLHKGNVSCIVYTVPRQYNQTVSCDGVKHELSRVDCWLRDGKLSIIPVSASGGMIAVLVIGAVFTIITSGLLIAFVITECIRCKNGH